MKLSTSQQATHLEFMYEKMCLRVLYRFLIFRIFISSEQDFKFDLKFSTSERRPFIFTFSTKIQTLAIKRFTVMVPLSSVLRSVWLNLTIDLFSFIHDLNVQSGIRKLQSITVYPFCYLSELSVTSSFISDSPALNNSQTLENNSSVIYQVLNVPKIRLNEWKRTELINAQETENSKDLLKIPQLTRSSDQSLTKTSQSSTLEGEKCISAGRNPDKKRMLMQINKVCVNEQSSTSFNKIPTDSDVSKDSRSFSADAISNRLMNTTNNSTNQYEMMNNVQVKTEAEKPYQSIRLGSLYLFNSLPQPAPSFFIQQSSMKDHNESLKHKKALICSKSSYLQRISIDHHSLKELTDTDLKFKMIMAPTSYHFNNDTSLLKNHPIKELNQNLMGNINSSKKSNIINANNNNNNNNNNSSRDNIQSLYTLPPIDLADYKQSDDLSASFEESLLASLKQAVIGSELIESDLHFLPSSTALSSSKQQEIINNHNHNNDTGNKRLLNETTMTPMRNVKCSHCDLIKSIPVLSQSPPFNQLRKNMLNNTENEQCELVIAFRKQLLNASFSDNDEHNSGVDDEDTTTTTDGLGSLIYLRYHLARHHQHHRNQRSEHNNNNNNQYLAHEKCDHHLQLCDMNHSLSPNSETNACHQENDDITLKNENYPVIHTPSRASSLVYQRTHSTEDLSKSITGFELSSHWGTETANSSNESISYPIYESIPSSLPQSAQLVQHMSNVCQMDLQNTGLVNNGVLNNTTITTTTTTTANNNNNSNKSFDLNSNHDLIELIYDPILNCYYDLKSGRFYELI
ncbi:unnamed protein product [Schistosoma turkestanicum]|nr:unnamed protein product [Schistosoma turkestanicum]